MFNASVYLSVCLSVCLSFWYFFDVKNTTSVNQIIQIENENLTDLKNKHKSIFWKNKTLHWMIRKHIKIYFS
jgi:hypothetical protein